MEAAQIQKGETVLEIGPGLGILTDALLEAGANVIAIEQDKLFAEALRSSNRKNLEVVEGDAASIHWHEYIDETPWRLVANLPYAITSITLRKALWNPHPPELIVLLIQRDVAERALESMKGMYSRTKKKSKTSLLSLMLALSAESARIVRRVPSKCFYPAPKVESAVIEIIPLSERDREKKWGDPEAIMELARYGFAHPRKLLSANLHGFHGKGKEEIAVILKESGLNPKARAEDLNPEDWSNFSKALE
jgi:16S rRNA (adenine1518-N6/adenine1519-N6)-dimethyltransferase